MQGFEDLSGVAQLDYRAGVAAGDIVEDAVRAERYQLQREV